MPKTPKKSERSAGGASEFDRLVSEYRLEEASPGLPTKGAPAVEERPEPLGHERTRGEASQEPEESPTQHTPGPSESDPEAKGYAENGWGPKPSFANQIQDPTLIRYKGMSTHFLDLSKPEDMEQLQALLSEANGPYAARQLVSRESRDFDWCTLLVFKLFEFKQYVRLKKREDA